MCIRVCLVFGFLRAWIRSKVGPKKWFSPKLRSSISNRQLGGALKKIETMVGNIYCYLRCACRCYINAQHVSMWKVGGAMHRPGQTISARIQVVNSEFLAMPRICSFTKLLNKYVSSCYNDRHTQDPMAPLEPSWSYHSNGRFATTERPNHAACLRKKRIVNQTIRFSAVRTSRNKRKTNSRNRRASSSSAGKKYTSLCAFRLRPSIFRKLWSRKLDVRE